MKRNNAPVITWAVLMLLLILSFSGLPKIKRFDQVTCTDSPELLYTVFAKDTFALYAYTNKSLPANSIEVFNAGNMSQQALVEILSPKDGSVATSCRLHLKPFQEVSFSVKENKSFTAADQGIVRLRAQSGLIGGRISHELGNVPFTLPFSNETALFAGGQGALSVVELSNLDSEDRKFTLSGYTADGASLSPAKGPLAVKLKAKESVKVSFNRIGNGKLPDFIIVSPEKAEYEANPLRYLAGISVETARVTLKSSNGVKNKAKVKKASSFVPNTAALGSAGYLTIRNSIKIEEEKYIPLNAAVDLLNSSAEEVALSIYLQNTQGKILPFEKKSAFCKQAGSIKDGKLQVTLKPFQRIQCLPKALFKEFSIDEAKLVILTSAPGAVYARGNFSGKAKRKQFAYSSSARPIGYPGNFSIISWNTRDFSENLLNIYNPSSQAVNFKIKLLDAVGNEKVFDYSLEALSSQTLRLTKNFLATTSEFGTLRLPANIPSELIQSGANNKVNYLTSSTFFGSEQTIEEIKKDCAKRDFVLAGDLNRDGSIDEKDKTIVQKSMGKVDANSCEGDADGDGDVDLDDLLVVGKNWTAEGGIDTDDDGVFDAKDCSPKDNKTWRNEAFSDFDNDGIRDSAAKVTIKCYGEEVPPSYTLFASDVDNCPQTNNPMQEDSNSDGTGDACQPYVNGETDGGGSMPNGFPNPQTFKPLKTNPNGLMGEE